MRCVYTHVFSTTPVPEPGPEPPKPLPPGPHEPSGPDPEEPGAPWADLAVTKQASHATVTAGGLVTYRITVTNHGPDAAGSVVVDDKPAGGAVVISVQSGAGSCQTGPPVICRLDTVKPHAKVTITLTVRVPASASGSVANRADVGADTYDPNLANNVSRATVEVVCRTAPPVTG